MTGSRMAGSARRRAAGHGGLLAALIVAAVIVLLFATGRIEARKWQPFLELSTWRFLGEGLLLTLAVAAGSLVLSIIFGVALGVARSSLRGPLGWLVTVAIELARATPILAILFIVYTVLLGYGVRDPLIPGIIGLTIYNSSVIAEIVRAGIASVARGEVEAARSLGLSYAQTMRAVVLPQALSRMTPALVSQLITLNKDTTLLFIISGSELLSYGRSLFNFYGNVLETYIVIAIIFFAINYPLSRFSRRLETRRPPDQRLRITGEEDQLHIAPLAPVPEPSAVRP